MKGKVVLIITLFWTIHSIPVFCQSAYLEDGIGGSGVFTDGVIDDSGFSTIGFSASYSIGGMMDFGVELKTAQGSIDDYESTDLLFSLLYNLIIIKQNQLQPLNVQLEGSYGYVNTTSNYLKEYKLWRTGQGFNLGIYIFHNFFSSSMFGINLGGKLEYSNYLTSIYDHNYDDLDTNTPEIVSDVKSENIKYGAAVSVTFHPDLWPLFNAGLTVFYNPDGDTLEYVPSIGIISPQY